MILGSQGISKGLRIPISSYSQNLVVILESYLDSINRTSLLFSEKDTEKAKITLRYTIFPDKKEFVTDYEKIKFDIGQQAHYIISNYKRCTMQLLGKIAECLIIDRCLSNKELNKISINIALFKPDIYKKYNDFEYDDYIPFSPSYKYILINNNGVLYKQNITQYNPHDTSVDIAWGRKENILSQLKVEFQQIQYLENAKLQIKVSGDYSNVNLTDKYYITPIVYFDLCDDVEMLRRKYPNKYIIAAKEISLELHTELVYYFKILVSYITGIIDKLNVEDFDVQQNDMFAYVINSTPQQLLNRNDNSGIINTILEEAKKYVKPIIVEA
ncbi:hypothetical protein AB2T85_17760 [Clostridium butyricum]|uniref:hypothetical protein n=1 Tax=Clostridium butyricum TaxID=1492 RepID=UPI0034659AD9